MGKMMIWTKYGHFLLLGVVPEHDIDVTNEEVVQCDDSVVKILL